MTNNKVYDCAVIGGGLAGLTLAIQLAGKGRQVVLLEKESYPFHKVCGEYISMESWNFLESIGLPLSNMNLPKIRELIVTSPNGNVLQEKLDPGGFGISRYTIDHALKQIAVEKGVSVIEQCKVADVHFTADRFLLQTSTGEYSSKTCCGTFGKRSNLDVKWKRPFTQQKNNSLNNFIGVKYHVEADIDDQTIALHNFKNGYCGISRIEETKFCLCYLTTAANLRTAGNSIPQMEKDILSRNPHLQKIFTESRKLFAQPVSISQISFEQKSLVEDHILMIGDAAGMITPLCGNGMSMAMHGSKLAAGFIDGFLTGKISREAMESAYQSRWKKEFSRRLQTGRIIQRFFGKAWITNLFVGTLKRLPFLTRWLINQTHGRNF